MFTKVQRAASVTIAFLLILATAVGACSMLVASASKSAHDCCKTSHDSKSKNCQTKCAVGSPAAVSPGIANTATFALDAASPLRSDTLIPVPEAETAPPFAVRISGPPHPLYERNSALLI